MSTEEKNKMIAEFMGARPIVFSDGTKGHTFWNDDFDGEGRYGAFPDGATNYYDYDKGYHKSWNWLMPVVKKIRNVKWITERNIGDIHNALVDVNKEELHKAVVEFINQYNKNK